MIALVGVAGFGVLCAFCGLSVLDNWRAWVLIGYVAVFSAWIRP